MNLNDKIEQFMTSIINEAESAKSHMLRDIESKYEASSIEIKSRALERAKRRIDTETERAERERNKQIISSNVKARRELIMQRDQITEELFAEVSTMLKSFTQTSGYKDWLIKQISEAKKSLPAGEVEVTLNSTDFGMRKDIAAALNVSVVLSDEDFLGGCKLVSHNKKMAIDITLDEMLRSQKLEFNKIRITI